MNDRDSYEIYINFINHENVVHDGEEISLCRGGSSDIIARSTFKDGKAVLRGQVSEPTVVMMSTKNRDLIKGVKILLENTKYETTIDSYSIKNILFETTSSFHNVWRNFYLEMDEINKQSIGYTQQHREALEAGKQQEADNLLTLMALVGEQKKFLYKELGYKHPDNFATAYIYTALPDPDPEFLMIYDGFTPEVKDSEWGQVVKRNMDSWSNHTVADMSKPIHPLIGQFLPSIVGFTPEGDPMTLDTAFITDQAAKLTLIDFWASWCVPCRTLNAALYPIYFQFKDQGLQIYSFSIDGDQEKWVQAITEDNIPWKNFSDLQASKSPVMKDFYIRAIPSNVLVDATGKIIGVNVFNKVDIVKYLE